MATKKPEYTKLPTFKVSSDDYSVTLDGQQYFPHKGEWLGVVPGITFDAIDLVAAWQNMNPSAGYQDPEFRQTYSDTASALFDYISKRIEAWSWTDNSGESLGPRPTPQTLKGMDTDEIEYMLNVIMRVMPGKPLSSSTAT